MLILSLRERESPSSPLDNRNSPLRQLQIELSLQNSCARDDGLRLVPPHPDPLPEAEGTAGGALRVFEHQLDPLRVAAGNEEHRRPARGACAAHGKHIPPSGEERETLVLNFPSCLSRRLVSMAIPPRDKTWRRRELSRSSKLGAGDTINRGEHSSDQHHVIAFDRPIGVRAD